MKRGKSAAALVLVALAAALPAGAQTRLNPTVTLLTRPSGPVPPDCETGTTIVAPRIEVGEPAPTPTANVPPPSNDLASALRRLAAAAGGDDYAEFKSALADARAAIASYP